MGEKDPTSTRSQASRSATNAASSGTAASDLMSMLKRAYGNSSKSWASVGHPLAAADERGRDLGVRELGDLALGVADPVQHGVVEGQQDAVAGGVHVGLEVAVAERDRVPERRHVFSRPSISGW